MDFWGILAIIVALFATFATWMLFGFREFVVIAAVITACAAVIAIYLHRRFRRESVEEQLSSIIQRQEDIEPVGSDSSTLR